MLSLLCLLLLILASAASSPVPQRGENRAEIPTLVCHISIEFVSTTQDQGQIPAKHLQYICSPVKKGIVSEFLYKINLPADFAEANRLAIIEGSFFVSIPWGEIHGQTVVYPFNSKISVTKAPDSFGSRHRRLLQRAEIRKVLVLRISAGNASVFFTAEQIYNFIFNTTDPYNQPTLSSQFELLSFGKLKLVPTKHGVMDIRVPLNASLGADIEIRNSAIALATSQLGLSSLLDVADHVIFCIPPGTGKWAGGAIENSWVILMNDQWCSSLSGLMHEMGHNLGLLHSNVGSMPYVDLTSYMSGSYLEPYWMLKSFNGANNAQLGWYRDRQMAIDPHVGGQVIRLTAFVDYNKSNSADPVLVRVGNSTFLQFNRAKGFNAQAQMMIDKVTVVQQLDNGTDLLGGVSPSSNTNLTITNFEQSGRNLIIFACNVGTGGESDIDWMDIGVGFDQNYCSSGWQTATRTLSPATHVLSSRKPTLVPHPTRHSSSSSKPLILELPSSFRRTVKPTIRPIRPLKHTLPPSKSKKSQPTSIPKKTGTVHPAPATVRPHNAPSKSQVTINPAV